MEINKFTYLFINCNDCKIKHICMRENTVCLLTLLSKSLFYQFCLKFVQIFPLTNVKCQECLLHSLPHLSMIVYILCKEILFIGHLFLYTAYVRKKSLVLNVHTLVLNVHTLVLNIHCNILAL